MSLIPWHINKFAQKEEFVYIGEDEETEVRVLKDDVNDVSMWDD